MNRELPLFQRAAEHAARIAIIDGHGLHSYRHLLDASAKAAATLRDGDADLQEARIAFLAPPGFDYVAVQWGIWRAGGVAVPLCERHPAPELEYVLDDAGAALVVVHPQYADKLSPLARSRGLRVLLTSDFDSASPAPIPYVEPERRAMILYTSGTTALPKGVVTTHANLQAQVESLINAWEWTCDDHILHVLPLHHVHGIINVLTCALWAGAICEMPPRFDAEHVWSRLASRETNVETSAREAAGKNPDKGQDLDKAGASSQVNLFMAVPTIYARLIVAWESASPEARAAMSRGCARMRLMVSGSAALPVATLQQWKQISGQVLLERYGMTEIGMALSNPLHGRRQPGHVGAPLPGMEVRLVDQCGNPVKEGTSGEIEVRGDCVFEEYWRQPKATKESFRDGWFRTGDVAVVEDGSYRILGRNSVDIIKTGGYKVSALEIEEVLRRHEQIRDCAVVGLDDPQWGQRVAAALVTESEQPLTLDSLRKWAKQQLADYKVPTRMQRIDELPKNVMGKVDKRAVQALFTPDDANS